MLFLFIISGVRGVCFDPLAFGPLLRLESLAVKASPVLWTLPCQLSAQCPGSSQRQHHEIGLDSAVQQTLP